MLEPQIDAVRTDEPNWQAQVINMLLEGEDVTVHDVRTGRSVLVRAKDVHARPRTPAWTTAKRLLKEAGVDANTLRLPRSLRR